MSVLKCSLLKYNVRKWFTKKVTNLLCSYIVWKKKKIYQKINKGVKQIKTKKSASSVGNTNCLVHV